MWLERSEHRAETGLAGEMDALAQQHRSECSSLHFTGCSCYCIEGESRSREIRSIKDVWTKTVVVMGRVGMHASKYFAMNVGQGKELKN